MPDGAGAGRGAPPQGERGMSTEPISGLRSIQNLHKLALKALEALPERVDWKETEREALRFLRDQGDRERLVDAIVAYMREKR